MAQLVVVSANPGIDANRITVNILFVYGMGGTSVSVGTFDYNRVIITVTEGFTDVAGTNDDWATIAAAINTTAGAYVVATGLSGDTSIVLSPDQGLLGATQGADAGQYYGGGGSPVTVRKRFPQFTKGRGAGQGVY